MVLLAANFIASVIFTGLGVSITGFATSIILNLPEFQSMFILAVGYFLCVILLLVGIGGMAIGLICAWNDIKWIVAGYNGYDEYDDHIAEENSLAM